MLEPVDIVNEAAALAGANPIGNLDDNSSTAGAMKLAYDRLLGHMLGIHWFSWSLSTRQLSRLSDVVPLTGYKYVFALPGDRVGNPRAIIADIKNPTALYAAFLLEGDQVHADDEPLFARIRVKAPPRLWSGPFREAFTVALAANFALSLKRNRALAADLSLEAFGSPSMNQRGGKMLAAILDDAQSTPSMTNPVQAWDPLTTAWVS
ncbi:hypothetical protein AncyloWKF20_05520 [Ancylobacter sp. WKF20]|uniref:hypothetical protein n=1 Tax=Ancylobacter sp. WKF20 TaxID=3039801 RepID=UPI00243421E6|nr:hypothetical protein [Ancylobacter sp. WKF20]WGD31284.1 hypothetical protein AncyloWKF20_05520 [Ancylobacter sp. WKF20]